MNFEKFRQLCDIDKTAEHYIGDLERDSDWLTDYAQDKADRQRLIEITVTMNRARWFIGELANGYNEAPSIVPSADRPQRQQGEWEIVTQGWHSIRRCSNCKWTQTYSDPKYMGYEYNYCPNCGAKMFVKDINVPNKKGADDE